MDILAVQSADDGIALIVYLGVFAHGDEVSILDGTNGAGYRTATAHRVRST